jgi:hypothetical protein
MEAWEISDSLKIISALSAAHAFMTSCATAATCTATISHDFLPVLFPRSVESASSKGFLNSTPKPAANY